MVPLNFKFINDELVINIPENHNEQIKLKCDYNIPINSFTRDGIFAVLYDNYWLPIQYINFPSHQLEIEVPINYEAYFSGNLIDSSSNEDNTVYKWKNINLAGSLLIVASKNLYSVNSIFIDDKKLSFYLIHNDKELINRIINETSMAYCFYKTLFGDCKTENINIYEFPGVGYATTITNSIIFHHNLIENTLYSDTINLMNRTDTIPKYDSTFYKAIRFSYIKHEMAHLWLGMSIYYKYESKYYKFIVEGLTEYIKYMLIENEYGKNILNDVIKSKKEYLTDLIKHPQNDIALTSNSGSSDIPYIKGPLVFHYVRKQIGDENWIKFLRTLYSKYYHKTIDYDIFKAELLKYDKTGKIIKRMEEMTEMKGMLPEN